MRSKMEEIKKRDQLMHPINAALWNECVTAWRSVCSSRYGAGAWSVT